MAPVTWKRVFTPAALTAALLLLVGSLLLPAALRQLGVVLRKQAVPLRAEFDTLTDRFGDFELLAPEALLPDVEKGIGTPHFISWLYRDRTREVTAPDAAVRLHIAYYTGRADTVPHVPELCYVASGVQAVSSAELRLALAPTAGGATTVPLTQFVFRPRQGSESMSVFYFFIANGRFFGTKTGVRLQAFDVRDRYAYYCKVEVMPGAARRAPETGKWQFAAGISDSEQARAAVQRFLTAALPEIQRCLPDWTEVRAGRYPPPEH